MLTIRPTKMLARRLGIELPPVPPAVTNRVADWCAHEFRVARHRYLIFCNTASLYPVLTYGRGVTDDHELIERLAESVKLNTETFPAACCGVFPLELGRRPASPASAGLCKPRVESPELAPGSSAGERAAFNMAGTELEFQYQRWIVPELAVVQWAPIPGKSILGSMNDMISMAKYHLDYRDESPVELSHKLAKAPMSALGMNSPDRVFPTLGG